MIKNIIFDFGGVLLDIDYSLTDLNIGKFFGVTHLNQEPFKSVMEAYEIGSFSEEDFVKKFQALSKNPIKKESLIQGWNSMLGPLSSGCLELLKDLRDKYELYLLSNTNPTHLDYVYHFLEKSYGIRDFGLQFFDKAYFSHIVGMRKPNLEIYQYVIRDADIRAEETLFIDDSAINVQGSISAGLNGVIHDPQIDIVDAIDSYICGFS